jgi:redox-sensing transcriptional repressor
MNGKTVKVDKLPTVRRLPTYLQLLRSLARTGSEHVSSGYLAAVMGIEPILVRKDLELTGISGTPRVGYPISALLKAIEDFLGWDDVLHAFLIGAGKLGTALLGYDEFVNHGLKIIAAFDNDPAKIGTTIQGIRVFGIAKMPDLQKRLNVGLAVLALPPEHAQSVTDILVQTGIRGIWNFTSVDLDVPPDVITQKEDMLSGLAVLSVKMARNGTPAPLLGGCSNDN